MSKIIAPKGTHDIYMPEIEKWHFLEKVTREHFQAYFYSEIRTPIFERAELFQRGIGRETEVVQKEMYQFEDRAQRKMVLRPENTASVVRSAIENNLFNTFYPLRFFYMGPMFRYDKPQKGRYRQFHQLGVEIFGEESSFLDAEVISVAFSLLNKCGLNNLNLEINSVGCKECRPSYLSVLSKEADKNREDFCKNCQRKVDTNPLRIFDCKIEKCKEIASDLPKINDNLCDSCDENFEGLKESLFYFGVDFKINPMLVRGLDYYTKTAFEITSNQLGAQNALLGGGRYANLVEELGGPKISGIGFAAGMERIILHLKELELLRDKRIFIVLQKPELLNEGITLCQQLRERGFVVLMDYKSKGIGKQLKKAEKANCDIALIIGEEEISSGLLSIKKLRTHNQLQVKRKEIFKILKEQI